MSGSRDMINSARGCGVTVESGGETGGGDERKGSRASSSRLGGMTAQIGADGADLFGDPDLKLLTDVAGIQPERGRDWVHLIDQLGFQSTQRLWIGECDNGVAVATWPAELQPQARYLYDKGFGSALVDTALKREWKVEASPHIAHPTAGSRRRLYMLRTIAPRDYVACWENKDALDRVRSYSLEDVEHELWPWLKQRGIADDGDNAELLRFLAEFPRRWDAHMRPGLRFRRVWASDEARGLGSTLAETIRSEFNAVFATAHEPALGSADTVSPGLGAPYRQAQAAELSGSPEPFSVDPEVVERGLRGHADTQNELATALRNAGIEPRSCLPTEPPFDLAWQQNGTVFVAEVKSVNDGNEEGQLRLGLGQVLRYRQRLLASGHERVVAVLVPERQPRDPTWHELCHGLGVVLLSRNELERAPALDVS
jgi:hypothetical protein